MANCNSLAVDGQPVEKSKPGVSHGKRFQLGQSPEPIQGCNAAQNQDIRSGAARKRRMPLGKENRGAIARLT